MTFLKRALFCVFGVMQCILQVHLTKIELKKNDNILLSLISESETHVLHRFITQSEIFQAFVS